MFRDVAIVGVAESDLGYTPAYSAADLMAQASVRALAEAGIGKNEVDGLFSSSAYYFMPTLTLGEYMGIVPKYTDGSSIGGASFVSLVGHAAAAISMGLCEVALVAYGSTQRSDNGKLVSMSEVSPFEEPFGPLYPISAYALAAQRHMHEFGTTRQQLSEVAAAARRWAALNEKAFYRQPLTLEEVSSSALISSPLRKLDCCLVTDGGAALVLTSTERAKSLKTKPVFIWGYGESHDHRIISAMPDFTTTAAVHSGKTAYVMAGIEPRDVQFAELYDAFTINTLLFLEDLGFCDKGKGGPFAENQGIGPGGRLPVNTNGGGLSYCHPGMYGLFLLVEAVRQLRGECGARQVNGCRLGLVHGNGGVLSSQVTMILSNEKKS